MGGLEGLKQEQVRALIGKFYIENWMKGKMIHIRSFSGYFDVYLNLTFSGTSPLDDPISDNTPNLLEFGRFSDKSSSHHP